MSNCASNYIKEMPSFKGSFSFKNEKQLEASINVNVSARLRRIGLASARLYFVQGETEVNIPEGLVVLDETNGVPLLPLEGYPFFILVWSDNYTVNLNGVLIMSLTNQRQWAVSGDRVQTIDN